MNYIIEGDIKLQISIVFLNGFSFPVALAENAMFLFCERFQPKNGSSYRNHNGNRKFPDRMFAQGNKNALVLIRACGNISLV